MRYLILSIAILLGLSTTASSGTISKNNPDRLHIEYGAKHKCVLRLVGLIKKDDATQYSSGSCVIVDPNIAITAAHAIASVDECFVKNDKDENIPISACVFPRLFIDNKHDMLKPSYDIAVCYLEKPIQLDFYPRLYDKNDESGKICSMAGFGISGIHGSSKTKTDKLRRAGSNIVDGVFDGMLECSFGYGQDTKLEFLINSGDSGGGLFIDKKLAGINSSIYKYKGKIYNNSRHTRISMHKDWIESVIKVLKQNYKEK